MTTLNIVLALSIAIIVFTYWKTINSSFSRDRKIALYIVTLIIPVLGLMLYFIFRAGEKRGSASS